MLQFKAYTQYTSRGNILPSCCNYAILKVCSIRNVPQRMLYLECGKYCNSQMLLHSSDLSIMQAAHIQKQSRYCSSPATKLSARSPTPPPPEQTLAAQTGLMGGRNKRTIYQGMANNSPSSAVVAVTVLLGGPTPMLFTLTTW